MIDPARRKQQLLEAQVEAWTTEAKKLVECGKEEAALALYRRAADELSGAPWLQHRTAELARKLKQPDVAITYFRRAATAFQLAEFPKRAIAPLRTAWTLAIDALPSSSALLVSLGGELMQLHKALGFSADATVTFERTNVALRQHGFAELPPSTLDALRGPKSAPSDERPDAEPNPGSWSSLPPGSQPATEPKRGPASEVVRRGLVPPPESAAAPTSRALALAKLLGRRR